MTAKIRLVHQHQNSLAHAFIVSPQVMTPHWTQPYLRRRKNNNVSTLKVHKSSVLFYLIAFINTQEHPNSPSIKGCWQRNTRSDCRSLTTVSGKGVECCFATGDQAQALL